ncbi:SGNH/GDSL hydrolase family protein [Sunxiuqinia indica]|uniref:hypothetical protein n=1 Tax=Sunxiuqinia indica TaxID=2692584 RepID=UPI001358D6D4|nr:hypothetical protein [Sunxiuqinia indica]
MTPAKEFFYFFVTLLLFSALLLIWEGDVSAPGLSSMTEELNVDSIDSSNYVVDSPKVEIAGIVEDSISKISESEETADRSIQLFHSTPLIFAEDDSLRFQLLSRKLSAENRSVLPVRIVYFGDSQIENDRITSALRKILQLEYAGKGPGFIPLDEYYNTRHQLLVETSKAWDVRTFRDRDFKNQSLLFKNAILTADNAEGWFRIRRIKRLQPQKDYQLVKLYYSAKDTCFVTVKQGRREIYSGNLNPKDKISTLDFQFNHTPDDISFDFTAADTFNVAGLSLESEGGVFVDNVALRGLSYPPFEMSDQESIKQMLDQVNVGLFVLHFGVNLVPYTSKNDYLHFRIHFQQQISFLKLIRPEVPILIIGVSDMAQKEAGQFKTYSTITAIKQIQFKLAMQNHAAFWDLQSFMGGEGSMKRWVEAAPALGRKDYIHFSRRGADLVGTELAKTILQELKASEDSL